ncbi:hypothetical protein BC834DRAFT_867966 [Gloeopeniophorella convolvens]|nr:hypothetical protein BC834DRAFT_867966 [Gloeopeniophorella convolvens]
MHKVSGSDSDEHSTLSTASFRHNTERLASASAAMSSATSAARPTAAAASKTVLFQPQISPSARWPSPSASAANYTRRTSLATHSQQPAPQPQLSVQELARHGIKVRDFAYESNLPSIPSIPRIRQPVPNARPLKRLKRQSDPLDEVFPAISASQSQSDTAGPSSQTSSIDWEEDTGDENADKAKRLERKSTEPIVPPASQQRQRLFRDAVYADLSQPPSGSQPSARALQYAPTPVSPTLNFARPFHELEQQRLLYGPDTLRDPDSQEIEPHVNTPLVTPQGSLTWPTATSDMPAPQALPPAPTPADMTPLQPGFSLPFPQPPGGGSPRPATEPATSPHHPRTRRASTPPSPSPRRERVGQSQPSPPSAAAEPPTPRYFLRKRGPAQEFVPVAVPAGPAPRCRRKSAKKAEAPYTTRMPSLTRQAASASESPRARPVRKAAG